MKSKMQNKIRVIKYETTCPISTRTRVKLINVVT